MSRNSRKPPAPVGNPHDPQGNYVFMQAWLESMRVKNFSEETVIDRHIFLTYFLVWAEERGIVRPSEVTKPILERFQRYLYHYRKENGEPLSFRTQHHYLTVLRCWFKWLAKTNRILYNPASELELPKLEYRLPKHVLSANEADRVINVPDVETPTGLRDRAILETFYSTGIRRKELGGLGIYDLDTERGTLMIRQGKGKKDRVVPIGDRAMLWVERYLQEVRPGFLIGDQAGDTLFLTETGLPFTPNQITQRVRHYVDLADLGKTGSCHLFRHTMATLMLENGADIRFIQAMLGHARIDTTAIYTRVSIRQLKEIHTAAHPAKLKRKDADE